MKTKWDYTNLAKSYLKRPKYAPSAIDQMIKLTQADSSSKVCDIGAGVAHLTKELLERNLNVVAIEPNDEMRKYGVEQTRAYADVQWVEGTGENTKQQDSSFDIVTFGSSFNVTDRQIALQETQRILKPNGWFVCMWNHRNLSEPLQNGIESIIKKNIPNYDYGTRRESQESTIDQSGLFGKVHYIEGDTLHQQSKQDVLEAWRSHATLERQAGPQFAEIIQEIEALLRAQKGAQVTVPYTTRMWCAQLK